MSKKSGWLKKFGIRLIAIAAMVAAYAVVSYSLGLQPTLFGLSSRPADTNSKLANLSDKVNKNLPKMVDKYTRWDYTTGGNDKFLYHFTFVYYSANEVDKQKFKDVFSKQLKNKVCASKIMKKFLENGVKVQADYVGDQGSTVGSIEVSAAQCR